MLQTAFNGVVTGVIMTLPALAVTLLFGVLKFPNFAVGAMMTVAAYMVFALNGQLGWPLAAATGVVAVAFGGLCIAIDQLTFKPLRGRGGITLMVASLGLGFILENIARFAYGNTARSFAIELARPFRFLDVRMNREQMITLAISALAMTLMWLLLTRTPVGRAMRAVADNPQLALVRGIEAERIIRWTWFITGILLAVGGVLIGMDRALEPPMGSNYVVGVFAAAILGGLGSALGAFAGAMIIGVVSELSTLVMPPNYRIGIPLAAIALILVFRPQGLFGQPLHSKMISFLVLLGIVVCFSAILALALNFQWGLGGMVNFGLAGFYTLGAYSCALLILNGGANTLAATLGAMAIVAAACAATALVTLRVTEEDYFAIVTLGVGEMLRLVALNEDWLTKGALGLTGIPRPLGDVIPADVYVYFLLGLSIALLLGTLWVLNVLARSPFGRVVRALREDDVVAATLGKNVLWARVRVFAIGGAFIGLAGSMHAFYYQYIDPTQFTNIVIAYAFMAVIAGGRGAHAGAIWGAAAVMVLLEGSRFLKDVIPALDSDRLAAIRIIIIGVGLILLLIYRPQGFMREYRLQVELK